MARRRVSCRAAADGEVDCRARSDEGARRAWRPAIPRRSRHVRAGRRVRNVGRNAEVDRRTLRPVVEGLRSGDGQGGLRRVGQTRLQTRVHRRHHRRRLAHEPRRRSGVRHRAARRRACAVLRPRCRRNGWRQQELREDPRGGSPPLRAGLLRLRLEEVRLVHDFASALRPEARARAVPAEVGQLRRRTQVRLPVQAGRACRGGARRHGSRQQPVRSRRRVGRVAAQGAATDHRQASAVVRHRRVESCVRPGSRLAQQHHSSDVLLCAVRRAAARRGDRRDQAGNRTDLRPQGGGNRQEELRGHRQCARQPARSRGAPRCDRDACRREDGAGLGARLRAQRHRRDDGGSRRLTARQRVADRRYVPDRDDAIRKAQHRGRSADLGTRPVHPVRPVLDRLPAQRHPCEVLRPRTSRGRACRVQGRADQCARISRFLVHASGLRRGLHRLRRMR